MGFLISEYDNPPIILFGSYSKGEDTESSDIDIYVENASGKEPDLSAFERKLGRKIHMLKYRNLFCVKNKDLANNMVNGFILNGYVGVFK